MSDELEQLRQERNALAWKHARLRQECDAAKAEAAAWRRIAVQAERALLAGRSTALIELAMRRDRQRVEARFAGSGGAGSSESPAPLPTTGEPGEGESARLPTPEVTS